MKKPFVTLLLMVGAAVMVASSAFAQSDDFGIKLQNAKLVKDLMGSRAARLSVSTPGTDPETVYVGKSATYHGNLTDNYWNIYTGTYLPGTGVATNALWDWDNNVGIGGVAGVTGNGSPDSLQGWWPMHRQYNSTGGLTLTDDQRPWWALDHGNVANYVLSQQSSAKRTFGVVGLWHSDPGSTAGNAVFWSPLTGAKSAWCGLRQHGDLTVKDVTTNQPFNQDAVWGLHDGSIANNGSPNNFPGYPDQIDQMLYRDIVISAGQALTVSFKYRTRMSTSIGTTASTRTGWFHGDPLAVTSPNFISSSAAGLNAPQDSFMVYVGAPVNDAACVYSDGVTRAVYDKQRRWFSEVIKVFGTPAPVYTEIFRATGNNPATVLTDTTGVTPSSGALVVPGTTITSILGSGTEVRLVFRCKTNRGFADSDTRSFGYTSSGRGAVQIDDVSISGGASPSTSDFEGAEQGGANNVDNRFPLPPALATPVGQVWRSTGKPPGEYFHLENLAGLTYNDLCGPSNSTSRVCNISGVVLTPGNHDDLEKAGDSRYTAFREISHEAVSPTINCLEPPSSPLGTYNSQGMRASILNFTDDLVIFYDLYAGMFNLQFSGETWNFGSECYPSSQPNGAKCWSPPRYSGFIVFNPEPQCFTDFEPTNGNGTPLRTSNASGLPDSIKFFFAHQQQCFRFAISSGCNSNDGGYFDNATLAFIDLPPTPGQASASNTVSIGGISSDIWQFVNDTFPANETNGVPGTAAFDTTSGLIRTGLNTAQATGNSLRFDIPGDSSAVTAGNATVSSPDDPALTAVRVDLVFRVLPGPGNYQIAAGRNCPQGGVPGAGNLLLQLPTNQGVLAAANDLSFWGQYMGNSGEVTNLATSHNTHTRWNPLTWNSARMDTAEFNIFPSTLVGTGLTAGNWMTMMHESDPKFTALGVNKFKCFLQDTLKTATGVPGNDNVNCSGAGLPAWLTTVPQSRTGYDGNTQTKEFTKIIPDGLLTPGSHVQYFNRKSHAIDPLVRYSMCPDTNFITPQNGEGSSDQHRWQQFGVLPDRWKSSSFGGAGDACMLYIDLNDRRGNEGRFVSTMDSIGATAAAKLGAHNGWSAGHIAGADGLTPIIGLDVRDNMAVAVSDKNSQPGTTWDMYGVKASESLTTSAGAPGSRLANRTGLQLAAGRESKAGPTPEMLRAYYRIVAVLTGDLNSGVLGPFTNRSQNDISLFTDYLVTVAGLTQPRGILVQGDGFGQSEKATGGIDPTHLTFMADMLGVDFRNPSYQSLSGNTNSCTDLLTTLALSTTSGDVYGVANSCTWSNDVYRRNAGRPEATEGAFYENVGLVGPYVSDVVKVATGGRNWVAVTSGFEIEHLYSRYCDTGAGRITYYYHMLNKAFSGVCTITGAPLLTLDTPQGNRFTNFMKIGNSVMKQGTSLVHLSVAKAGRIQVSIYDVTGRRVRNLADRVFPPGAGDAAHTLQWDGTDDSGSKVARGVYFVRSSVQKDAGRIIVLNN